MVSIILPYNDVNPQQWLENLNDATLIFLLRESNQKMIEDVSIWLDDGQSKVRNFSMNQEFFVFQISNLKNPIAIPYKISVTSPNELSLIVDWNSVFVVDTSQAQTWLQNQTDLNYLFAIKEQNYKPISNITISLKDTNGTYPFSFSTASYWTYFQVKELKPDLLTPFDISVTSSLSLNLDVYKV